MYFNYEVWAVVAACDRWLEDHKESPNWESVTVDNTLQRALLAGNATSVGISEGVFDILKEYL